jgi:HEAT repeat protein
MRTGPQSSAPHGLVFAMLFLSLLAWPGFLLAVSASLPKEIQSLYDKKDYQKALDEIAKLDQSRAAAPDVRRVKVRSLVKLGHPKEALEEYDKLKAALTREDLPLLREVAMGFIVVMMKDMREQMRGAAYTALKEVESDEVVPLFEDGLSDGSGPVRVLAVEGLGRSEAGRRSAKLRTAFDDQAGLVKARVVKVLGRSGDPAVLPLIEAAAKDELNQVRIAAYAALIRLGHKDAWESLRQAADVPNPEDRAEALRVIADLHDQRGASLMMDLLAYKQPSVRGAAVRGLGQLGRKEAREKIEELLQDPIPGVRESAAVSLAELGATESVPALMQLLKDGTFTVRAAVVAALLQLGQPFDSVAQTARALAQQNDTGARAAAAHALGKATKANAAGAISLLQSLLADPLPTPRIVAVRSLGHIGDRDILPALKDAMRDQNDAVRATAGGAVLHILQKRK